MATINDKLTQNYSRGLMSIILAGSTAFTACTYNFPSRTYDQFRSSIEIIDCSGPKLKVDDGDTIFCEGRQVRILGIDSAEIEHPEVGIFKDQEYGREGLEFAQKTLPSAERVLVLVNKDINNGKDKYGRTLGHVLYGTKQHLNLYGAAIIQAGLAYQTITAYGDDGFPGYAWQIVDAAAKSPLEPGLFALPWPRATRPFPPKPSLIR